jgi:molybdenum cofactor biosynthesis enzyme
MDKLKTIIEQRSLLVSMDMKGTHHTSLEYNYLVGFEDGLQYVYDIIKELEESQCINIAND